MQSNDELKTNAKPVEIVFKNNDSEKNIKLTLKKETNFIYGANGSGKTTFSRHIKKNYKNSLVFNLDFINENIYVTSATGAKTDSNNKDNLTELFISEETVGEKKEIERLKRNLKFSRDKSESLKKTFSDLGKASNIVIYFDDIAIINQLEIENNAAFDIDIDEDFKNIKILNKLKTSIIDEEDWEEKANQYKSDKILENIFNKISSNKVLNDIFNDQNFVENINNSIEKYNNSIESIKIIDMEFSKLPANKKINYQTWINNGLELHTHVSDCLFCDNNNIQEKKENWEKILSENSVQEKNIFLKYIVEIMDTIERIILTDKELYKNLIPQTLKTMISIYSFLQIAKNKIIENEALIKLDISIKMDHTLKDKKEAFIDLVNFKLNQDLNKYIQPLIYLNSISSKIKEKELELELNIEKVKNETIDEINGMAKLLGLSKEINLSIDRKGSIPKISLSLKNKKNNIQTLSEGQKHKLGLAVFFAKVKKEKHPIDFIVLDDPMLSLDVNSYHGLKSIIIGGLLNWCIKNYYINS